jgi:hypothetical protein
VFRKTSLWAAAGCGCQSIDGQLPGLCDLPEPCLCRLNCLSRLCRLYCLCCLCCALHGGPSRRFIGRDVCYLPEHCLRCLCGLCGLYRLYCLCRLYCALHGEHLADSLDTVSVIWYRLLLWSRVFLCLGVTLHQLVRQQLRVVSKALQPSCVVEMMVTVRGAGCILVNTPADSSMAVPSARPGGGNAVPLGGGPCCAVRKMRECLACVGMQYLGAWVIGDCSAFWLPCSWAPVL